MFVGDLHIRKRLDGAVRVYMSECMCLVLRVSIKHPIHEIIQIYKLIFAMFLRWWRFVHENAPRKNQELWS